MRSVLAVPDRGDCVALPVLLRFVPRFRVRFRPGAASTTSWPRAKPRPGVAARRRDRLRWPAAGSLTCVVGGKFGDRFGGGQVTLGALAAMTVAGRFLVAVSSHDDLTHGAGGPTDFTIIGYAVGFIALFIFCGIGKGRCSS